MKEKRTLKRNSKITILNSKLGNESKDMTYYGNHCTTQYWVHNNIYNCIAKVHIPNEYDELATILKHKMLERKQKAIVE